MPFNRHLLRLNVKRQTALSNLSLIKKPAPCRLFYCFLKPDFLSSLESISFEYQKMLLSNLETVPGHTIRRQIDVVYGSTVRSKHVGRDLLAGLKNIVGGELTAYTELLEESRQEAMNRMIEKAKSLGANAVVGIRFSTSNIAQGASELFVYGTAVVVEANAQKLPDPFPTQG
jgi:uncharacterized protein YbjQ (UPF0145 family)